MSEEDAPPERMEYKESYHGPDYEVSNPIRRFARPLIRMIDGPVTWFNEKVLKPEQRKEVYYHQQFKRAPTVDECYSDDIACHIEAHEQFKRDRKVESCIIGILRNRYMECLRYHGHDQSEKCSPLKDEFEFNQNNWFIKYGDIGPFSTVLDAYYKQVHRLVWARRHGRDPNE